MTNFKQALKYELKQDVPFTDELKQKLISGQKRAKKKSFVPYLTGGAFALIAMILFLFVNKTEPYVLLKAEDVPTAYMDVLEILQKTEARLPLVKEVGSNQTLYTGVDTLFKGKLAYYGHDHVIVEKNSSYSRGDYVLFQLETGEQYVRQVLAFEKESFEKRDGEVFVEGKQLMLPGLISTTKYKEEMDFHYSNVYFNSSQAYDTSTAAPQKLKHGEMLVQAGFDSNEKTEIIQKDQVIGKVVALQYFEPTFLLTGDDAEIFASFKKDHNVEKLIGLDPALILRMYTIALMEHDVETLYAMVPSHVSLHDLTLAQFEESMFDNKLIVELTESEKISTIAYQYNGLENAQVEIIPKTTNAK